MLRSEFDQHPLWQRINQIHSLVDDVRNQEQPTDLPAIERIELYVRRVEGYRRIAGEATFFTNSMLESANSALADAVNGLTNRLTYGATGGYIEAAAIAAENVLNVLGPWPRPTPKAFAESTSALFEELLETQRRNIDALTDRHAGLLAQVDEISAVAQARHDSEQSQLDVLVAEARDVAATVDNEKARIDKIAQSGSEMVESVRASSKEAYETWLKEQAARFKADFEPLSKEISQSLETARTKLEQLKQTEEQYANLAAVAAGQTLANHFQDEAKFNRWAGFIAYSLGFLFLVGAAVPLVYLLFDPSLDRSGTIEWGRIVVRAVLAVVAGSAATVVIRLGARLLGDAGQSKRMELELRAFDPFMSSMTDRDAVDAARVDLVDRTFGRSAGTTAAEEKGEVLPVGTFTQIIAAVAKLLGR
ncbi:hypothetical protein [Amnibacterium kyonggiense]|uniref:Uncharacterized protein n=1 Tax=Amnibacterium kyonggiense TaxID=595671 RepID=A0A4R7FJ93_9MICO|nr:hypothetical protein [Amnibacterium kyonggiense]TDS75906.1 hypothetical protein CLV52_3017 [Amnibacterium kyonggiense]